jgi:hypothetical protein
MRTYADPVGHCQTEERSLARRLGYYETTTGVRCAETSTMDGRWYTTIRHEVGSALRDDMSYTALSQTRSHRHAADGRSQTARERQSSPTTQGQRSPPRTTDLGQQWFSYQASTRLQGSEVLVESRRSPLDLTCPAHRMLSSEDVVSHRSATDGRSQTAR